jgi:peptide/nickel transport system permease protein
MLIYFLRRLGGMLLVMLIVATLVFFLTRLAPGDPAALMLGDQATAADIATLRQTYGLDKPLLLQFMSG